MSRTPPSLVVLAAGMGSRYGGLKQIDVIGPHQETLLDYSIYDALKGGFGKLVFVIRRDIETAFRGTLGRRIEAQTDVHYVFQDLEAPLPAGLPAAPRRRKPWGTAHAVWVAQRSVDEPFAVINADDFYGAGAYREMAVFLGRHPDASNYAMVGYRLADTLSEHGHVSRGVCRLDAGGKLQQIVERTRLLRHGSGALYRDDGGREHRLEGDEVVSMNFWGFNPSIFPHLEAAFHSFLRQAAQDPRAEIYLPTVINRLVSGKLASVDVLPASGPWYGLTHGDDRPRVRRGIGELVRRGDYPEGLWRET